MLLYHCTTCGYWQDISLTQGLQKAFLDSFFKQVPVEQRSALVDANVYDCPEGHGALVQIKPEEKIMLRPKQSDTEPRLKVVKPESAIEE